MIVSFDLDDTLFVSPSRFKTEEELGFPWNKIYKERLRYGTKALIEKLHNHGIIDPSTGTSLFRTRGQLDNGSWKNGVYLPYKVNIYPN